MFQKAIISASAPDGLSDLVYADQWYILIRNALQWINGGCTLQMLMNVLIQAQSALTADVRTTWAVMNACVTSATNPVHRRRVVLVSYLIKNVSLSACSFVSLILQLCQLFKATVIQWLALCTQSSPLLFTLHTLYIRTYIQCTQQQIHTSLAVLMMTSSNRIISALLALCVGIHRSPVNSPHKGKWRGALMFSLTCAWTNVWVNNLDPGDLRRHRALYDGGCNGPFPFEEYTEN